MDRIFGISRALDYIEQHITEPTDYEAVSYTHLTLPTTPYV